MDFVTIGFCVWVILLAWRGGKRGLWPSLASSLAVLCGYLCCFFTLPSVLNVLDISLGQGWHWMMVAAGVFFAGGLIAYLAIHFIGSVLPLSPLPNKIGGTIVGGVYGLVVGVFMLWGLGLLFGAAQHKPNMPNVAGYFTSPVVRLAGKLVGDAFSASLQWHGVTEQKAKIAGAFAQQPGYLVSNLQEVTQSPVTKQFLSNRDLQEKMASQDIAGLQRAPEFQAFIQQPAVQEFVEVMEPLGVENSEEELAKSISNVWRATQSLQDDPEFRAIVDDDELKAAIENQDTAAILRHPKASALIALVVENVSDGLKSSSAAVVGQVESIRGALPSDEVAPVQKVMYQWLDEKGAVNYSDFNSIPKQFREHAVPIEH